MRHRHITVMLAMLLIAIAGQAVRADTPFTDRWFLQATQFEKPTTARQMAKPDFLCGKSFETLDCHIKYEDSFPDFYGVWQLIRYDQKHNIAFAWATTDQLTYALFRAPASPKAVADADLSQWTTARGLHIGSSLDDVISAYGPPLGHGERFAALYTAVFPAYDQTLRRHETLHEFVTLVIDHEVVTSIVIYIQCCNG